MPKYPTKPPNPTGYKRPSIDEQLQRARSQRSMDPDALSNAIEKSNCGEIAPIVERLDSIDRRLDGIDSTLKKIEELIGGFQR